LFVTFYGYNFGTVGGGSIEATIDRKECTGASIVNSHSTIVCTVPQGRAGNLNVTVTDAGVAESCAYSGFNYIATTVTGTLYRIRPDTDASVFVILGILLFQLFNYSLFFSL